MQQILDYWDIVGGVVFVALMLLWVTNGKRFFEHLEEKRRARETAEEARREEERRILEENIGWDGLHSK